MTRGDTNDPCPHCLSEAWVDLASDHAVESLTELERSERFARKSLRWRVARRIGVAVGATLMVVATLIVFGTYVEGVVHDHGIDPFLLTLLFVGAVGAAFVIVSGARADFSRTRGKRRPARWFGVQPPGNSEPRNMTPLELREAGPLLTAPLSGRPCLAYEVGVRRDANRRGPPGTWLLLEQRSAPVRAGAWASTTDGLAFDASHLRAEANAPVDGRYLREHGLSNDETYVWFEAVLMPGSRADVAPIPGTGCLRARVPARGTAPSPRPTASPTDNPYAAPRHGRS